MGKIITTIKVTLENGTTYYKYSGGPFEQVSIGRSYLQQDKHPNANFKGLSFSKEFLEKIELPSIKNLDPGLIAELIELELDDEYRFIKEKESK